MSFFRRVSRISRETPRGTWIVIGLLSIGFVLTGLTWWHYVRSNPSTRDAVMIVMPPSGSGIPAIRHIPTTEKEQTELEIALLIEDFNDARKAIEHALVMVEEQKENFGFAQDRYERLMPLVETGALDPLSASQIQSAYIAARASLAQAKYFLAQAQRDYGTPEYRSARLKLLQARLPEPEAVVITDFPTALASKKEPQAVIEAVFTGSAAKRMRAGMLAKISFPTYPNVFLRGTVVHADPITLPHRSNASRVKILVTELPTPIQGRKTVACHVTVDTTTSIKKD